MDFNDPEEKETLLSKSKTPNLRNLPSEDEEANVARSLIAEFMSSFLFTYVTAGSFVVASRMPGLGRMLFTSLAYCMSWSATLYAFSFPKNKTICVAETRHISPTISLALFFARRIDLVRLLFNCFFQISGAACAAGALWISMPHDKTLDVYIPNTPDISIMGVEIILTFICIMTVIMSSFSGWYQFQDFSGGMFFACASAGGLMNPSLVTAFAILDESTRHLQWAVWTGSIISAILASILCRIYDKNQTQSSNDLSL